ncbi:hypothetical protein BASA61_007165 [Batrachochytrium salamandrivorans]|nr:hypothetical protein BASA61_007165 [Batrachochytrium salamandrivorans]
MLVSSVIALLAIGFTSVSAADYAPYNLLKDDRDAGRLVFLPTTLAQKEVILSNVEKTLNVWVNYDSKIANYGSAADPFPIVKNLRKNINTITDEELQLGLTDAFARARDQHTRWTNIAPSSPEPTPQTSYTVNVPYVSGHDEDCWSLGSNLYKSLTGKTLPGTPPANPPVSAEQPGRSPESNTTQLSPGGYQMRSSRESRKRGRLLSRALVPSRSLRPEDVETKSLAVEKAIMIIRSLLVNELSNTKLGHLRAA